MCLSLRTPLFVLIASTVLASVDGADLIQSIDFNAGDAGFTVVSTNAPGGPWSHDSARGSWSTFDRDDCGPVAFRASRLNSPIWTVLEEGPVTLTFSHRYSFEADDTRWDGAQLRLSVNQGPYQMVAGTNFSANGYNNTVGGTSVPNNELLGLSAFTATSANHASGAYISSVVTLGNFHSNDTISVQFLAAWDDCTQGSLPNWEIDSLNFAAPLEDRKVAPSFSDPLLPADASVTEGLRHVLTVAAQGIPVPNLQWFKDEVQIVDAINSTYSITNMTADDAGQYFVRAVNSVGSQDSRIADITFVPDTTPPELVARLLRRDGTILLSFSEPLDPAYGFDPFSAAVFPRVEGPSGDLGVMLATVTNQTNVVISLSNPPVPDVLYVLGLLSGVVADFYGNPYESGLGEGVHRIYSLNREAVIFAIDAEPRWKYHDLNIDLQSQNPSVFAANYDDSAWPAGAALLGRETATTPEVLRTSVSNAPVTTFYRTRFTLVQSPLSLRMRTVVDDGVRVFINGGEVFRLGMPALPAPISFGSLASRTVGDAAYEGPFDLPVSNLVVGENVMAVAIHQSAAGSSDNLWGCELIATYGAVLQEPIRIRLHIDASNHAIIEYSGGGVHVQEAITLNGSPIEWTTLPNGPHSSPFDAGPASGTRFFRLTTVP